MPLSVRDENLLSPSSGAFEAKHDTTTAKLSTKFCITGCDQSDHSAPMELNIFDCSCDVLHERRLDAESDSAAQNTSMAELVKGRQNLKNEVSERTGQLKALVKENFDRFISCKNTIDDIHKRLRKSEAHDCLSASGNSTSDMVIAISEVNFASGFRALRKLASTFVCSSTYVPINTLAASRETRTFALLSADNCRSTLLPPLYVE